MSRRLSARLGRLEETTAGLTAQEPSCIHHGDLCGLGEKPLPQLYLIWHAARTAAGREPPPLDEHRPMTPAEHAESEQGAAALLAEQQAKNEARLAQLRRERG